MLGVRSVEGWLGKRSMLCSNTALVHCHSFSPFTSLPPAPPPPTHTHAAPHDLGPYLSLLRTDGKLVLVGLPPDPLQVAAGYLISRERVLLLAACC